MFAELRKIFDYLTKDEQGKSTRNWIFLLFFLVVVLALLNKFVIVNWIDDAYFMRQWALSHLTFREDINPYRRDIASVLRNSFPEIFPSEPNENFVFQLPIFQLFIFYPFTFIRDTAWAQTIWMTINQLLVAACVFLFTKTIKWDLNRRNLLILLGTSLLFHFVLTNILRGNIATIQLTFVLGTLYYYERREQLKSGIYLGLLAIDPFHFLLAYIFLLWFFFRKGEGSIITWAIITLILLSIAGVVFQSDWPIQLLRNLVLENNFFPFISYADALQNNLDIIGPRIILNYIPMFFIVWIVYEWLRSPKRTFYQEFWLIGLSFILNPLFVMRADAHGEILIYPVYLFIIFLWMTRSRGIFNWIIVGFSGMLSVVAPLINQILTVVRGEGFVSNETILLVNVLFLWIMMYWVRWWVLKDYSSENERLSV